MAKTVTCAHCGAEQAIQRQEDGGMSCVFCGEPITDLPPYEEGEELTYAAEEETVSAAAPRGEAVEATYVLSRQEVARTLTLVGRLDPHVVTSAVETGLFLLLFVMQGVSVLGGLLGWKDYAAPTVMNYVVLALVVVMIPVVWIMPRRTNRRIVDRSVTGHEVTVRVYENLLNVHTADSEGWQAVFGQEKITLSEQPDLLLVTLTDGRLLALPRRAFTDGDAFAAARERLLAAAGQMTPLKEKCVKRAEKITGDR